MCVCVCVRARAREKEKVSEEREGVVCVRFCVKERERKRVCMCASVSVIAFVSVCVCVFYCAQFCVCVYCGRPSCIVKQQISRLYNKVNICTDMIISVEIKAGSCIYTLVVSVTAVLFQNATFFPPHESSPGPSSVRHTIPPLLTHP